jgi:CheY-like chemotaxis protein
MMRELNKTILLIDDDPVTNLVNRRIIERNYEHEIQIYTSANEALEALKKWPTERLFPEVILLDIDMPDMDGWDFLESFEKLFKIPYTNCNIAILTASIFLEDIERSKTYKCVRDFISKPLAADKLRPLLMNGH